MIFAGKVGFGISRQSLLSLPHVTNSQICEHNKKYRYRILEFVWSRDVTCVMLRHLGDIFRKCCLGDITSRMSHLVHRYRLFCPRIPALLLRPHFAPASVIPLVMSPFKDEFYVREKYGSSDMLTLISLVVGIFL